MDERAAEDLEHPPEPDTELGRSVHRGSRGDPRGVTGHEAGDRPTCVSLFSGIGGLDEGLRRAGYRHLLMCEADPYRRDVLRARFPGVPVHEDVCALGEPPPRAAADERRDEPRESGREAWAGLLGGRDVALLCGGFPCQDLSVAGRREGLTGRRSGLFFEYARIAEALRPRWLLVENVPGLLSSNGGRDFGIVLGTLADIGYGLAWRTLDSRFFGVPQRRRRVFIIGALADGDPRAASARAGQILAVGTRCPRHPATRGETRQDVAGTLGGGAGERGWAQDTERMTFVPGSYALNTKKGYRDDDADTTYITGPLGGDNDGIGRRSEDDPNLVAVKAFDWQQTGSSDRAWITRSGDYAQHSANRVDAVYGGTQTVRRLTPTECERLQALPDGWTDLGDTPDSRRYAALGDAVTATVAEWIGRRILEADL